MSTLQIISLLFSLKAQLAVLQKELLSLENASSSAVVSSTPLGFVPWTPPTSTPHSWIPETNTASDNPMALGVGESTSTETMASIQLSGNDGYTLSDGTEVYITGQVQEPCVVIFDQNGNPITDASATITTDSLTNTQQADGTWSPIGSDKNQVTQVNNFSAANPYAQSDGCSYVASTNSKGTQTFASAPGYQFAYAPPADGSHEITVSALGSTQSVEIYSASSTNQ